MSNQQVLTEQQITQMADNARTIWDRVQSGQYRHVVLDTGGLTDIAYSLKDQTGNIWGIYFHFNRNGQLQGFAFIKFINQQPTVRLQLMFIERFNAIYELPRIVRKISDGNLNVAETSSLFYQFARECGLWK